MGERIESLVLWYQLSLKRQTRREIICFAPGGLPLPRSRSSLSYERSIIIRLEIRSEPRTAA